MLSRLNFTSLIARSFLIKIFLVALFLIAIGQTPKTYAADPGRPFGDAHVVAQVPTPPGFPEGISMLFQFAYISGPATFGTAGGPPSKVLVFNTLNGQLLSSRDVQGEDLTQEHANSCVAHDGFGRVYVLNTQLGVIRFDPLLLTQQSYASPFPDLPACNQVAPGTPCSPTPFNLPPLPNDLAFDPQGNLYVTDSMQATIWRIPAGGGAPQIWFQDIRIGPGPKIGFGANGIRLNPQRTKVFVAMTEDPEGKSLIYSLPLKPQPTAADLKLFHEFAPGDLADGMAFGLTGTLYVAIATPFNSGISLLNPDGSEKTRLKNAAPGLINPYDSPSSIAFNNLGSIMVVNHALFTGGMNPGQFQLLDVFVKDLEAPLVRPLIP